MWRDLLEAGSDVDPVAEDVVAVGDDVPEIDAKAEGNAPIFWKVDCLAGHCRLYLDRAAHGIDHARELQQQAVAGGLNDAAAVHRDGWIDDLLSNGFQCSQGAALVPAHQPRVARDVSGHDRGKAALFGHSGKPANRAPSSMYS